MKKKSKVRRVKMTEEQKSKKHIHENLIFVQMAINELGYNKKFH